MRPRHERFLNVSPRRSLLNDSDDGHFTPKTTVVSSQLCRVGDSD
ncbi:hypothetical protein CH06BL_42070 [Chromobacterium haemolyticum]|nr:hypothetical protein CH06BL_42070 [Chromobacterium haemolyticum]